MLQNSPSTDQISTTLIGVLSEYLKTNERTVFWSDDVKANVDPFQGMESGFFAADWQIKVRVSDSVSLFIVNSVL